MIETPVQAQTLLTWLSRTTWKDSVSVETASQEIVWDPEVPQTVSSSGLVTLIALAMAKKAKVEMRVLVNIYASVTARPFRLLLTTTSQWPRDFKRTLISLRA